MPIDFNPSPACPASPARSRKARWSGATAASLAATLALACGFVHAQPAAPGCGDLANSFGPHDYRTERGQPLYLVESAHFTPQVEALIRGATARRPGSDIDYTLRAFPNHHRALLAMVKLAEAAKTPVPPEMRYSVDCWFDRAIRFRADDYTVRMIYAGYLGRQGRADAAKQHLELVAERAGDNGFTHYNVGLVYFELRDHERALRQAHRAMALGFTRPDLRERLTAAGRWSEPAASGVGVTAASAPASSASSAEPAPPAGAAPADGSASGAAGRP